MDNKDEALYIDGLPEDEQPGMFVIRFKRLKERATDDEVVEHYTSIVKEINKKERNIWYI